MAFFLQYDQFSGLYSRLRRVRDYALIEDHKNVEIDHVQKAMKLLDIIKNRRTIKYQNVVLFSMVSVIIIPILIVTVLGLSGYLAYRFLLYDLYCKWSVNRSLQKYNIKKTPSEIIREYYATKGEEISHREIQNLEKNYRQNEPDQFLAMYDVIRDNQKYKK